LSVTFVLIVLLRYFVLSCSKRQYL